MKDVVSIELVGETIVIRPEKGLREGWFDGYVPDKDALHGLPIDDVSEWEWE